MSTLPPMASNQVWKVLVSLTLSGNLIFFESNGAVKEAPALPRDYCKEQCTTNEALIHVMCKFWKEETHGPQCLLHEDAEFHHADALLFLDLVNQRRSYIARGLESKGDGGPQPAAADMRQLGWSLELAYIARRWALQCNDSMDECRDLNGNYFGQMEVTLRNNAGYDWERVSIYDAINSFYSGVDFFPSQYAGNYTPVPLSIYYEQLVRAAYNRIGCSRVHYYEEDPPAWCTRIVCNIGPGDNTPGRPLYTVGTPCSKCPKGTSCSYKYAGLCEEAGGGSKSSAARTDTRGLLIWFIVIIASYFNPTPRRV